MYQSAGYVCNGSRAAVAGTRIVQPVHHQLRKCLVRSGTYASCHKQTLRSIFTARPRRSGSGAPFSSSGGWISAQKSDDWHCLN